VGTGNGASKRRPEQMCGMNPWAKGRGLRKRELNKERKAMCDTGVPATGKENAAWSLIDHPRLIVTNQFEVDAGCWAEDI